MCGSEYADSEAGAAGAAGESAGGGGGKNPAPGGGAPHPPPPRGAPPHPPPPPASLLARRPPPPPARDRKRGGGPNRRDGMAIAGQLSRAAAVRRDDSEPRLVGQVQNAGGGLVARGEQKHVAAMEERGQRVDRLPSSHLDDRLQAALGETALEDRPLGAVAHDDEPRLRPNRTHLRDDLEQRVQSFLLLEPRGEQHHAVPAAGKIRSRLASEPFEAGLQEGNEVNPLVRNVEADQL